MAIEKNFTGFEFGGFAELNYGSGAVASGTLNSIPNDGSARSGTFYAKIGCATNSGNLLSFPAGSIVGTSGTVTTGNHKRVSVRAYFRIDAHAQNGQIRIFGFGNDAGTCTVQFGAQNSSGGVTQPGTKVGLRVGSQSHNDVVGAYPWSAASLSVGVWYRLLLEIDLDVQATTTLSATLQITEDSGSPSVDFALTNSVNIGATDNIDKLALGYSNGAIGGFARTATVSWDDIAYTASSDADAATTAPELPSETRIYSIVAPTGHAVLTSGWSGTYADVDEYPLSGSDKMSSSTAGDEVQFTHASGIELGYAQVEAMKLYVNALVGGTGTGAVDYLLNGVAKSVTLGTNYPASASGHDPIGGLLFSTMIPASFAATTFGLRKQNGTEATWIGNIGLEVIGTKASSYTQIRGKTQIKAGSIYDAQIADDAQIARHKIAGMSDSPAPIFFPEEEGRDDWMIPAPSGSASVRIPVVPVFFPEDSSDDPPTIPGPAGQAGATGSGTTNNYYYDGLVLLAELSASASSTLDFISRNAARQSGDIFQSDFDEYIIEMIDILPGTNAASLQMRVSTNNGSSWAAGATDYQTAMYQTNQGTFSGNANFGSVAQWTVINSLSNTAGTGASASAKFFNPLGTSQQKRLLSQSGVFASDGNFYNETASHRWAQTTAVNAFRLFTSSGTFSGTVRVYGVSKTAINVPATTTFTVATTGNIDDLDFSGADLIRMNNASLATIRGLKAGADGQRVTIVSVGAGQVNLAHQNTGSVAANRMIHFVTSGITPLAAGAGTATYQYDATTARWRLVAHEQGAPISVPYTSTDYTADVGTWTVDSGDLTTYAFYVRGKNLKIDFTATTTTISSSSATRMQVLLPNGYTYVKDTRSPSFVFNGGTSTVGMARSVGTETRMFLYRDAAGSAYNAETNTVNHYASFEAEID